MKEGEEGARKTGGGEEMIVGRKGENEEGETEKR